MYDIHIVCAIRPQYVIASHAKSIRTFSANPNFHDDVTRPLVGGQLAYSRSSRIASEQRAGFAAVPYDGEAQEHGILEPFLRALSLVDLAPPRDEIACDDAASADVTYRSLVESSWPSVLAIAEDAALRTNLPATDDDASRRMRGK